MASMERAPRDRQDSSSKALPTTGWWINFPIGGVQMEPAGVSMSNALVSAVEWVIGSQCTVKGQAAVQRFAPPRSQVRRSLHDAVLPHYMGGELGGVNGAFKMLPEKVYRADMILMCMGSKQSHQFVAMLSYKVWIRHLHAVAAFALLKSHPTVHHQPASVVTEEV